MQLRQLGGFKLLVQEPTNLHSTANTYAAGNFAFTYNSGGVTCLRQGNRFEGAQGNGACRTCLCATAAPPSTS